MAKQRRSGLRRLYRTFTILASVLLLLGAAGGASLWLLHGEAALRGYRSPIRVQPRAAGDATPPLSPQVVLVIVDGLRYDTVAEMPTLSLLQRQGASARAMVRPPSYSQPTWTTLVTGASAEISGASLVNATDSQLQPIAADHIFTAAKRAGLSTALLGSSWWGRMIPAEMLDAHFFVNGSGAPADEQIAGTALRFLRNFHPNLTLIHFDNVDEVAHETGAANRRYQEAALAIDDHLQDIVDELDLRRAVLIVVSDHGHIDRGGHGGADPDVITTPFVAVGGPLIPGDYGQIAQTDIAPTIAALIGAPIPGLSQGSVRSDMLRTDPGTRAAIEIGMARQHREYGSLYLRSIGSGTLSETAIGDTDIATSSLQVGNLESAYRLAHAATKRIDQEVAEGRIERIQREQSRRLPLAAACVALPLLALLLRGGWRGFWLLLSALVTLAVYQAISLRQGQARSFSGLVGQREFIMGIVWPFVWASVVGALLLLGQMIRTREDSALEVIQTSLSYSLLVVYLLGIQAAIIYWLNGLTFTWYIPDFGIVFWQLSTLVQALVAVAIGLAMPILLIVAGLVFQGAVAINRHARVRFRR